MCTATDHDPQASYPLKTARAQDRFTLIFCHHSGRDFETRTIHKLKDKDKARVYSPAEVWCLPAPSTKPEEREFVVDSEATKHILSRKDLNLAELETVRVPRNLTTLSQPTEKYKLTRKQQCTSTIGFVIFSSDEIETLDNFPGRNKGWAIELCEISPKVRCAYGLKCWTEGIVYCTCGTCLIPTESALTLNRTRFDALQIPIFVIKKKGYTPWCSSL